MKEVIFSDRRGDPPLEIRYLTTAEDIAAGRELLAEYLTWAVALEPFARSAPSFRNIDDELESLDVYYAPPDGAFLLGRVDRHTAGCVALLRKTARVVELRRLFVRASWAGHGIGRRLVHCAITAGRKMNADRLILESHRSMTVAHGIYETMGFERIPPPADTSPAYQNALVLMARYI